MIAFMKRKRAEYKVNAHKRNVMRAIYQIDDPRCRAEVHAAIDKSWLI